MNIIFLDVDGVLNMYGSSCRTFMKPYRQHIEPHLVCRLNYICENVKDLKIVISSSWRSVMEDLEIQIKEQGFKYWDSHVIGKTPHIRFRGHEIQAWINENKFKDRYLVIDDEITDICGDYCNIILKENVLKTDGNEGLLHKDAMYIINYFKEAK